MMNLRREEQFLDHRGRKKPDWELFFSGSLDLGTHSFFLADFLFSSLTSWLGSRSFTSGSSVRLAGMMSNSRSLLSCTEKRVLSIMCTKTQLCYASNI